jgi:fatty-acyl-CoA synthase
MMFTQARLTCPEGKDVPNGDVGELLLRGPHVSKGYWNHPETTADSYDEDGYFHTGDLAVQSPEGIVTIVGRLTDMFISGGVNIYPPEIEAELLLNEDVVDAVVLGVPDPVWGETGVAFVLPKQGKRPSKESLTNYLQSRIARFKIPKAFVLVASLPRTPYGKVRKSELREAYLEGFMENLIPRTGKEASLGAAC